MSGWSRRSVLATGAVTSIGSVLAASERGAAESGDEDATRGEFGWSSYRGTPGNTAYVPTDGSFPEPETVAWEYDRGGRAAVVDGTVYLRTEGAVHALEATDGSVGWRSEDVGAGGTPAVAGDAVVVGGQSLTVLEANTGEVRWSEPFDAGESEPAVTSPTVVDGTAYAVAAGELLAYDVADGEAVWTRESVELEESNGAVSTGSGTAFGSAPVAVANGLVYALADVAGVAALDAEDGTTAWTHRRREYDGLSFGGVAATARRVYVSGSPEDEFPILDAATGERLGTAPSVFPTAATESVRVAVSRNALRVTDYETDGGWEQVGGTSGWRDPAIVGETVLLPYYPGYNERAMFGLALEDGSERWEFTHPVVDGDALADWYAVTAETLYTNGENGLVALRAEGSDGEDDGGDDTDEEDPNESDADDEDESGNSNETDGEDGTEPDDGTETDANDEFDGEDADEESAADGGDAEERPDGDDEPADETDGFGADAATGETETDDADAGTEDDADGTPGFTAGAGIAGGVLGLEWLRRRANGGDESEASPDHD